MASASDWEIVIIGGGLAGLSAAIYLGRALRQTLVLDDEHSLALWEPLAQNYLGFPEGVDGRELLARGKRQAQKHGVQFETDTVLEVTRSADAFQLRTDAGTYRASRLLLATGLYHLPPEIPGVDECLGQSMFFCKDCDAYRVQGRRIAIIGKNDEAVEYGLAMLLYSPCVLIATNGKPITWSSQHARWIEEYRLPVMTHPISGVEHTDGQVQSLQFSNGERFAVDSIFTTRGDVYHNRLAQTVGAELDAEGQVVVGSDCRTSVPGLYAAGCITTANCQMIIAAGQGAAAAQAINRNLFEESLENHSLRQFRRSQLEHEQTVPDMIR